MRLSLREAAALVRTSDAITAPPGSVVERIEDAYYEHTRGYPGYFHGNRLVLDAPLTEATLETWLRNYRERFVWRDTRFPTVLAWYEACDAAIPSLPR